MRAVGRVRDFARTQQHQATQHRALLDRVPVLTGPDKHFGFNTSATTKPQLIQRLASALEHDGFQVPVDYADELRSIRLR